MSRKWMIKSKFKYPNLLCPRMMSLQKLMKKRILMNKIALRLIKLILRLMMKSQLALLKMMMSLKSMQHFQLLDIVMNVFTQSKKFKKSRNWLKKRLLTNLME